MHNVLLWISVKPRVRAEPDEPKAPLLILRNAFAFPHRVFTVDHNRVRVVDNAIADSVGEDGIAELITPARDIKLRAKYGGYLFVPGLNNLKQITGLHIHQRIEQPFVNDKQRIFFILSHDLANRATSPGDGKIHEQFRQTDVFYGEVIANRRHSQSAGEVGLAAARGAEQHDIVVL